MGEITADGIKWYRCVNWAEGGAHGGAIDTGNEITSGASNAVFDDVSNAERVAGDTEYRKVFIRNENDGDWPNPRAWIESQTPATNSEITILQGGSKSIQEQDSAPLSGTFTFAASTTVLATNDVSLEGRPGEKIDNSPNDSNSDAKVVSAVSADGKTITLAEAYAGTAGASKEAKLAPITGSTFVAPDSSIHADVLAFPTLAQNESVAIWIKRVISAAGSGYTGDTFELQVEQS
jgi:hypothetical protein